MLKCVLGFCLPLGYQKLESPNPNGTVDVDITVEILDILSVNDKEFSITMSMYFTVMWQESRITTNNTIIPGAWYPVSLEFLQNVWIPNVFIYNLKSFNNISVLKKLAGEKKLIHFTSTRVCQKYVKFVYLLIYISACKIVPYRIFFWFSFPTLQWYYHNGQTIACVPVAFVDPVYLYHGGFICPLKFCSTSWTREFERKTLVLWLGRLI